MSGCTFELRDANNNVVTTAISWAASAASGTINQGGVFTAGSRTVRTATELVTEPWLLATITR